jgi:hypothetical protein
MSLLLKRSPQAPKTEVLTPGSNYPVFALTDQNAVILSDNEQLLTVGYKQIGEGCDWSVVSEKLKKEELPEEAKKAKAK